MTEARRRALTEEERALLAEEIAALIHARATCHAPCKLGAEEQEAVIQLLNTRKGAIKFFIYVMSALMLWALKDIYLYIMTHLGWK